MSNKNKIDISLMVLTCLRSYIIRDRECCKIVNASLVTFSAYFTSITDELLMLRILRTIGYFPISIYFEFMKTTMSKGKVFIIEGLQAFSRIARNRDYLQQFPII